MQRRIFTKVPAKNPINEPNAAMNALEKSTSLFPYNSPIKAPENGPIIIPNGPKNIRPTIRPIALPIFPYLLPPYILVPTIGIIRSKMNITRATTPVAISVSCFICTEFVKYNNKRLTQETKGPGIIGSTLPAKPMKAQRKALINNKYSTAITVT